VPGHNHLKLVEFGLGTPYLGVGSMIVESFSFPDIKELVGSILPIYLRIPIYKKVGVKKDNIYYSLFSDLYIGGTRWGYRFRGKTPFDYIVKHEWLGNGDYINIGGRVNLPFLEIFSFMFSTGIIFVEKSKKTFYANLSFSAGTVGPVTYYPETADIEIQYAELNNQKLSPNQEYTIKVTILNRGTKVRRKIKVYAELIDREFKRFVDFSDVEIKEIYPGEKRDVYINVKTHEFLPKIAYRIKITGKDMFNNILPPYYLVVESE